VQLNKKGFMAQKLFIGNLSYGVDDAALSEFFAQAGKVVSARVITDRESGRSKGFGFVEYETAEEAAKAKTELSDKELDGRPVKIDDARPRD
jgi:RNA recognition motif-containing protein